MLGILLALFLAVSGISLIATWSGSVDDYQRAQTCPESQAGYDCIETLTGTVYVTHETIVDHSKKHPMTTHICTAHVTVPGHDEFSDNIPCFRTNVRDGDQAQMTYGRGRVMAAKVGSYVLSSPVDPAETVAQGKWLIGIASVLALLVIGGLVAFWKWLLPRLAR